MNQSYKGYETKSKAKKSKITAVIAAAAAVIVVSSFFITRILTDYNESEEAYNDLISDYVEENDEEENVNDSEEEYDWESVSIDFASLKAINADVVGWIRFDNTDAVAIDYPILQGESNQTYLRKNLYKQRHSAGSIFLEELNSADFSDYYNILYGHNMRNGTMFSALRKYRQNNDFYEDNQYFTIYTEDAAYRYQIFAYEVVDCNSSIFTVGYLPGESYNELINIMLAGSLKDTGIAPDKYDKIMTLSTCTSVRKNERFVVHAVLIDQIVY